jgi:uncharacterized secreted protein with C-terminal beta-propeller domain
MKELNDEFIARYDNLYKQMETTVVHTIAFADGRLNYVAAGEVSGHLLNQFSMDEDKGFFRMATTRGQSWVMPFPIIAERFMMPAEETRQSYNNVYVLDEDMNTVGSVENLAAGERIYSVRFMGDRGYVVTFKQTDPLFVLDLANPQSPTVLGQVKLPGFSNYLHPFNETVLIGIGKEATDKGDLGVELGGVKISLFDVSDPATPKEITSLVLGGRGSDSIAMYDHKAVLFSADKQLLSIPVTLTRVGSSDYTPDFQGALVMRVTASSLVERGRISHLASSARKAQGYGSFEQIQRTLYIGDYLYSLSQAQIQIHDLEKLSSVKEINLPLPTPIIDKPIPFSTPGSPAIE